MRPNPTIELIDRRDAAWRKAKDCWRKAADKRSIFPKTWTNLGNYWLNVGDQLNERLLNHR